MVPSLCMLLSSQPDFFSLRQQQNNDPNQLIRIIAAYIDHKTKALQDKNKFVKYAVKAIQCCLLCFEKCLKYLTRMALIIVVMESKNFCSSGYAAFKLIAANKARFAFAAVFTALGMILGKIGITFLAVFGVFYAIRYTPQFAADCDPYLPQYAGVECSPVAQPMVPAIITGVLAFFVASSFMFVVECAIDSILVSFSWDVTENDPDGTTAHLIHLDHHSSLRKTIDGKHPHQEDKEKRANEAKQKKADKQAAKKDKKKKGGGATVEP